MRLIFPLALLGASLLPIFAARTRAQDAAWPAAPASVLSFEAAYEEARGKSIAGITFTLDLGGGTQFHRGEAVPIRLLFSASSYNGTRLDVSEYSRVWRPSEVDFFFCDRPQDAPDPARVGFREGSFMDMARPLGPQVQGVRLTLNEYLRFDAPGRYRLFARSRRPFKAAAGNAAAGRPRLRPQDSEMAASDVIELEILDGEEWAQARSREIAAEIAALPVAQAGASASSVGGWDDYSLRFLDTPLSRRLMIRNYDRGRISSPNEFEYNQSWLHYGLLGSRDKDDVMRAIREQISDPDGAVPPGLLGDLAALMFQAGNPPKLPPYPAKSSPDSPEMKAYRAAADTYFEQRTEIKRQVQRELMASLELKRGAARAVSLVTLLGLTDAASGLDAGGSKYLQRQIVRSWELIGLDRRHWMLSERWPLLRGPSLLPLLRQEIEREAEPGSEWQRRGWYTLLLRRIPQLSPAEGRKYLLREMARPQPRVEIGAMLELPDEALPALDQAWLRNLRRALEGQLRDDATRIARLIARYASPSIAPGLQEILSRSRVNMGSASLGWQAREALLAYFVRVQPKAGVAMVEAAVAGGQSVALAGIAAFTMNAELEALCAKYLRGASHAGAADAALALALAGSPGAEAALWERLEKWHQALQGKALDTEQAWFEMQLSQALQQMPGPLLQPKLWARLSELCLSPASRQRLAADAAARRAGQAPAIAFSRGANEDTPWRLGSEATGFWSVQALGRKLSQFPRSTAFGLRLQDGEATPDSPEAARLGKWLSAHGYRMKVIAPDPYALRVN